MKISAKNKKSFSIAKVDAMELLSPYDGRDPLAHAVADGANDFAFRLSAELAKKVSDDNFVCSPYSVWLPLAALTNAINAQNKDALLSALGAAGITASDINKAASRMLYNLTNFESKEYGGNHNPLKIANAIFVDNYVTLQKKFVQTFMDYYRGNAINVDFSSKDAVDAVNRWASKSTDGLITSIIQEFDPTTVAAIANAIYFSDRWDWEFMERLTAEDIFHAPAGDTTAFYMLHEGAGATYYEDDKLQAMPLRFANGGGMYIILPKTGNAAETLSLMTNEYFNRIKANTISATGKLLLPRFSIESVIENLGDVLELLGVPLFNRDSASLTGGLIEEDLPVWLSSAIQKAVIHVDEKGTTAAAVTTMAVAAGAIPQPTKTFEMNCNKPFAFVLFKHTCDGGNQVLFTGIVNQP